MTTVCQTLFAMLGDAMLQGMRGCIHVAQDGWAIPQKLSLLRLVVVWVADAKINVMTMDIIQ